MLRPRTTLVIIIGVSECPRAPNLKPLPQCANSAADFDAYIGAALAVPAANRLNMFDSDLSASDQIERIEDWLTQTVSRKEDRPEDLLIYYTGHGGFARNDQSYFLAIRKTRDKMEAATSIRYVDLASSFKQIAGALRKYLILDCCFAAAAVLRSQTDVAQLVVRKVEDELPSSGTAVLCSSAAKFVSIAPPGEKYTMFSGALLQCLKDGVAGGPKSLTLEDVGNAARSLIEEKFPSDGVRPELHVPDQTKGNLARTPIFPNPGWTQEAEEATQRAAALAQPPGPRWVEATRTFLASYHGRLVAGALAAVAGGVTQLLFEHPLGTRVTNPPPLALTISNSALDFGGDVGLSLMAPLAPAGWLALAMLAVQFAFRKLYWPHFIAVPILIYACWALAWFAGVFVFKNSNIFGGLSSYWCFFVSGLFGSLTLFFVLSLLPGFRVISPRMALPMSLWFGLWGEASYIVSLFAEIKGLGLTYNLVLFVPWQSLYVGVFLTTCRTPASKYFDSSLGLESP
jgi:hypothetical protein